MKTRYKILIVIGVITSIIFVLDIITDLFPCWESKILENFGCFVEN